MLKAGPTLEDLLHYAGDLCPRLKAADPEEWTVPSAVKALVGRGLLQQIAPEQGQRGATQLKLSEAAQAPPLAVVKDLMRRFEEATYRAEMPADVLNSIRNIVQGIVIGLVAQLQQESQLEVTPAAQTSVQQPVAMTQGPQQASAAEAEVVAAELPALLEVVEDRSASPEPAQPSEQAASLLEVFEDRGSSPVHVAPRTNLPQEARKTGYLGFNRMPTEYKATHSALHPEEERLLQAAEVPAAAQQPTHSPASNLLGQPQHNASQLASSGWQLGNGQNSDIDSSPPIRTLEDSVKARPNLPAMGPAKAAVGSQQPGAVPPPPAGSPSGLTQDLKPHKTAAERAAADAGTVTSAGVHKPTGPPAATLPHSFGSELQKSSVRRSKTDERGPGLMPRKKPRRTIDDLLNSEQPKANLVANAPLPGMASSSLAVAGGQGGPKRKLGSAALNGRAAKAPRRDHSSPAEGASPQPPNLHDEIAEFVQRVTPSAAEEAEVQECVTAVRRCVSLLWPEAQTALFGSQAAGLAMPGSDIDIVVMGVAQPASPAVGLGLISHEKDICLDKLRVLSRMMKGEKVIDKRRPFNLINAKVPIIKCSLLPNRNSAKSWRADISMGRGNGVRALEFIAQYTRAMQPLRPLVLVLKALLKEHKLNEVHHGGLSSYSLVNMVIAHLLSEGYQVTEDGSQPPNVNTDLGQLLWGFLTRFGKAFDYFDNAVSVQQGGIVAKAPIWRVKYKRWLLAVEDPTEPGHDIASGSYEIQKVKDMFSTAAGTLAAAVEAARISFQIAAGSQSSVQPRWPVLSSILPVQDLVDARAATLAEY